MTSPDDLDDLSIPRLRDAINSHDLDRIVDCFTPDFASNLPLHPSRSFVGNENVRRNWGALLERLPDIQAEITRAAFDAATGITWSQWEMHGTAGGAPAAMGGVVVSTSRDGRIDWNDFYLDDVGE
jgi:ketosteroid isomerase-like protein